MSKPIAVSPVQSWVTGPITEGSVIPVSALPEVVQSSICELCSVLRANPIDRQAVCDLWDTVCDCAFMNRSRLKYGLNGLDQSLREWLENILELVQDNAPMCLWAKPARAIRLLTEPEMMVEPQTPQYVTLDQMAAMVSKSKDTLERRKNSPNSTMPQPMVEGGGGTASEWVWSEVRPGLDNEYKRPLPGIFPTRR